MRARKKQLRRAALFRGRYWDRTSDLFRVREARYRCANRPEPVKPAVSWVRSLGIKRADDEIRTRDIHLGKVVLYQLSYVRISEQRFLASPAVRRVPTSKNSTGRFRETPNRVPGTWTRDTFFLE